VALKQWKQSLVSLVQHNKKSKLKKMSLRKVVHLTYLCISEKFVTLRLLHSNKTFGRGVVQVAEVFRILGSVKHCSRYPLETRQS
jgi:hypothetical protein